jgi:hypothetical protein
MKCYPRQCKNQERQGMNTAKQTSKATAFSRPSVIERRALTVIEQDF